MSIDEMRKAMQEFCRESQCPSCPVVVVHGLCEEYDWENAPEDLWANAPEDLIEKAYLLAFGKVKEGNQMNITADDIRKAALELIEKMTMNQQVTVLTKAEEMMLLNELKTQTILGYINGVCELAKRVTEEATTDD